jgi:uncharacterized membrane protein YphA (DoxX/SURF4 family)
MKALQTTVAKVLFAVPFLIFGLFHFMNAEAMSGMVPSFIPGGVFWVYLTGLGLLAAPIAILTGKQAHLACLLLGAMLLIFALTIHLPAVMGGDMNAMPNFLKDVALAGGAFTYAGIFDQTGAA